MTTVHGECHCGNLSFEFECGLASDEIQLRACDCSFCRRYQTKCFSHPEATAVIRVRDESKLQRYRFGLRTTDFLICQVCGAYIGAVYSEGDKHWATLNFMLSDWKDRPAVSVNYDGQQAEERIERRKQLFTPVRFDISMSSRNCE